LKVRVVGLPPGESTNTPRIFSGPTSGMIETNPSRLATTDSSTSLSMT
jgi:hypothetical protein